MLNNRDLMPSSSVTAMYAYMFVILSSENKDASLKVFRDSM